MPWKEKTIMFQKQLFVQKALAKEKPFSHLCDDFNISRKTGYQLLNRYKEEGPDSFTPRSKKPLNSPNQTKPEVEEAIINTRVKFSTWGAKKIIKYLHNNGMKQLPSPSTVTEILKRNNMITKEESLKREKFIRFERENPNDLWQMDFKGKFQLLTKESCYPLTIIDDCSRFSLAIKACKNEQYLTVKNRLFNVFKKYGLPEQINVDNGNPWGNSKLLPYTTLTVWLMRLGICVTHSRPRHPQTNGKCERFHRTLKNDLIILTPMRNFTHAQKKFDVWKKHYNYERPHEAIDMDVPASRYHNSQNQIPSKLPKIEYELGSDLRKVRGNGRISFKNKEFLVGEAFKGEYVKVKLDEMNHSFDIYFGRFKIYSYDI